MKIDLKIKTDDGRLAFLICGNVVGLGLITLLLVVQFVVFPKLFPFTWALILLSSSALLYHNYRFFKQVSTFKTVWQWLKQQP